MSVLRIVVMLSITIMMAVFIVWEKNKIIMIGYQVAKLQENCAELSEENRKMNYYVNRLKSPEVIAHKVQTLRLPLLLEGSVLGTVVASQTKMEGKATRSVKAGRNKYLYTQKEPVLNCCSLHN
ncbi:MAG: hypothetical protein E3K32_03160 [wastewater metagenome]|nr:hypothetical protein [Candidatus Loosdrechtia aerotolerans]